MAAPVINSIVASPSTIPPKGAFVVTIDAFDPDSKTGILTGVVKDAGGNQSNATAQVVISDPLTYQLLDGAGAGFQITPRAGSPNVFDCVAP